MKTFENPYAIPLWEIKWKREIILILCKNPYGKNLLKPRSHSLNAILGKHLAGNRPVTFPVEIDVVKYFLASIRNHKGYQMVFLQEKRGRCMVQFDLVEFREQVYDWFENHVKEEYGVDVKA